jgi:DNA invertase Pin-like site-specific DNA recombinase
VRACIYARTCKKERQHHTTSLDNQVAFCRDLARKLNLTVEQEFVFTDREMPGSAMPSCWAAGDDPGRPALGALVEAVERREVHRIVVKDAETLGTTSEVLVNLLELFRTRAAAVITEPLPAGDESNPAERFAQSVLQPCLRHDTEAEHNRKLKLRRKKIEEIERLKDKIERLERELAGFPDEP